MDIFIRLDRNVCFGGTNDPLAIPVDSDHLPLSLYG